MLEVCVGVVFLYMLYKYLNHITGEEKLANVEGRKRSSIDSASQPNDGIYLGRTPILCLFRITIFEHIYTYITLMLPKALELWNYKKRMNA